MKSDLKYDLLIIGGGISSCVFASKYIQKNVKEKVGLIETGRGLGGRSSTRISKRYKGWKLNHGAPNLNIRNSKNNLLLKSYIDELLENKFIKIDDSELIYLDKEFNFETINKSEFYNGVNYLSLFYMVLKPTEIFENSRDHSVLIIDNFREEAAFWNGRELSDIRDLDLGRV